MGIVGTFNPKSVYGLKAWFDASDTSTITSSSGKVSQMNDKSGNGYHITQGTGVNQPTTGASYINGLNTLLYASGEYLSRSAILDIASTEKKFSVIIVSKSTNLSAYRAPVSQHNVAVQRQFIIGQTNAGDWYVAMSGVVGTTSSVSAGTIAMVSMIADGTNYRGYVNAAAAFKTLGQPPVTPNNEFLLGGANDAGQWNGNICDCVLYNRVINTQEKAALYSYMSKKWGIT